MSRCEPNIIKNDFIFSNNELHWSQCRIMIIMFDCISGILEPLIKVMSHCNKSVRLYRSVLLLEYTGDIE